jgi:hypothetical protein
MLIQHAGSALETPGPGHYHPVTEEKQKLGLILEGGERFSKTEGILTTIVIVSQHLLIYDVFKLEKLR